MAYTAEKPKTAPSADELRARIPGWGVDLDPADRPSVPRERFEDTGAHWDFPERQPEEWPRERSIEHGMLPPVFGTSCPPKGLSGVIRRFAYDRYSEGQTAHWMLLILGDRVDAVESHVTAALQGHPDPIATGLRSEFRHNGFSSRFGHNRTDVVHQMLDPLIVGLPWIAAGGLVASAVGRLRRLLP